MSIMAAARRFFQKRVGFPARCFSDRANSTPLSRLLPYQRLGVERLVQSKRLLLGDEMGLGKTAQIVVAIDVLRKEKMSEDMTVMIGVPKRLIPGWKTELNEWLESPFTLNIVTPRSFPRPSKGLTIYLIIYEICHKWRDELHKHVYDVLICDEAHYLKTQKSKRTLAVLGSSKGTGIPAKKFWPVTGTPVLNRPAEMFSLLQALAPGQFRNYEEYAKRFCNGREIHDGEKTYLDSRGDSNLDELAQILAPLMLRRLKKDVHGTLPLPPKYRSCVCLDGSNLNVAEHERERVRSMVTDRSPRNSTASDLKSFSSTAHSELRTYLEQFTGLDMSDYDNRRMMLGILVTVRKETALAKVNPAIEYLRSMISSQKKVVVFAHHRNVILSVMEQLGDQAVYIMGGTSEAAQSLAIRRFQEDPNVRVFVGSIRAAGVGLTLTAASDVLFL
jgi:SWI/SNF-related matrix-associated actin-dependent regulator 1 of chromatin subfamily A